MTAADETTPCPFSECGRDVFSFRAHWWGCPANPAPRRGAEINQTKRNAPYQGRPCVGCGEPVDAVDAIHIGGIRPDTVYVYECEGCGSRQDDTVQESDPWEGPL